MLWNAVILWTIQICDQLVLVISKFPIEWLMEGSLANVCNRMGNAQCIWFKCCNAIDPFVVYIDWTLTFVVQSVLYGNPFNPYQQLNSPLLSEPYNLWQIVWQNYEQWLITLKFKSKDLGMYNNVYSVPWLERWHYWSHLQTGVRESP